MTSVIKEGLMASFRSLAVDNVMAITIQGDCAVCRPEIKDRSAFENAVERLVCTWSPIVDRHRMFVGHRKVPQGESLVIRFGYSDARVIPIAPNQPH